MLERKLSYVNSDPDRLLLEKVVNFSWIKYKAVVMHLSSGEAGTPRPLQHTVLGQATWIKLSRLSRLCLSLHLDFLHMIPSTNRLGDTQIITHHWLKSHLHPTFVNHGVLFHSCMLFQWSVAFPINYTLASWESFCLLLEHTVQTWAVGCLAPSLGPSRSRSLANHRAPSVDGKAKCSAGSLRTRSCKAAVNQYAFVMQKKKIPF